MEESRVVELESAQQKNSWWRQRERHVDTDSFFSIALLQLHSPGNSSDFTCPKIKNQSLAGLKGVAVPAEGGSGPPLRKPHGECPSALPLLLMAAPAQPPCVSKHT